jgi:hypothetical protein
MATFMQSKRIGKHENRLRTMSRLLEGAVERSHVSRLDDPHAQPTLECDRLYLLYLLSDEGAAGIGDNSHGGELWNDFLKQL